MQGKGITKTELGNLMGVKKQNVPLLLQTNNIEKLLEICKHLNVSLNDIIGEQKVVEEVKGCIVYKGIVHTINNRRIMGTEELSKRFSNTFFGFCSRSFDGCLWHPETGYCCCNELKIILFLNF